MDLQTYRKCAAKTESLPSSISYSSLLASGVLVAIEDLTTILDSIKKNMFYNRPLMQDSNIKTVLNNTKDLLNILSTQESFEKDSTIEDTQVIRVVHSMIGAITEAAGELPSLVNATLEGRSLDHINLNEEYGDILWYVDRGLDSVGVTIEQSLDTNIDKLSLRYPEGHFDDERANVRNLDGEREILSLIEQK